MVKLTKIYTRGGDKGKTGLVDGSRVAKHDPRIEAFGAVDEANSIIGMARLDTSGLADEMLARIQNDLFDLGADLATPLKDPGEQQSQEFPDLRIHENQVRRLEREIDAINENLETLHSFVLPGGSVASAQLHLARATMRRAERRITEMAAAMAVNPEAIKYANRLSDHLFVLSRQLNENGAKDVLWIPGDNR